MILVGDWAPGIARVRLDFDPGVMLINLEGPVLKSPSSYSAALKAGPTLYSIGVPQCEGSVVLSLANNHMMDFGAQGLHDTRRALCSLGMRFCGAGRDIDEARAPVIIDDGGVRVGILACCEAQFGIATADRDGCAETGPWLYDAIAKLRRYVDAVIVSVHAAVEYSPWPTPYARDLYRSYIDAGATVVHGHHAHVPQGFEAYRNGLIFYGMGNFAVDPSEWDGYANALWSLGADVDFRKHPPVWKRLIFEVRGKPGADELSVALSWENTEREVYFEHCNRPIGHEPLLEAVWQEVAMQAFYRHGADYMGLPIQSRAASPLDRIFAIFRVARTGEVALTVRDCRVRYHMLACESHRQMLTTALGLRCGEIEDRRTDEARKLVRDMLVWPPLG